MGFLIGCGSGSGPLKPIDVKYFTKNTVIASDIIRKHLTRNKNKLEIIMPPVNVLDGSGKEQPCGVIMLQLGEYYYYVEFYPRTRTKKAVYYRTNINAAPAEEVASRKISISETALGPFTFEIDDITLSRPKVVFTFPKDILTRFPSMSITFSKQNIKPIESPLPIDNRPTGTPPSFTIEDLMVLNGDNRSVYAFDFIENILGGRSGFSLSFASLTPKSNVGSHMNARNTLAIVPIPNGRYYSPRNATVKINGENGSVVPPNTEMPRNASYFIYKQFEEYPDVKVNVTIESYRNSSNTEVSRVTFRFIRSLDFNIARGMALFMINNLPQ